MKANKFLRIALIAVFCMATLLCTACGGNTNTTAGDETTAPAGNETNAPAGNTTDVPTEDGKITFFFTLGEGSVELPEYACVYINGTSFNNWSTQDGTVAFQRLGETNIYYAVSDVTLDTTNDDCGGYQLTVGVTKEAAEAVGASNWGTNYNCKSEECAAYQGLEHPVFTYKDGDNKVDLGTQTFKNVPSAPVAPVPVKTTLEVTFAEALPEGARVLLIGSLNETSWDGEEMTSEDGKKWTLKVELLAGEYEYKVKVYTAEDGLAEDFSNKWDCGTEYGPESGNFKIEITEYDGITGALTLQSNLVYPKATTEE